MSDQLAREKTERRGPVLSKQKMAIFPTTLPETNSSRLKIDGWKTILSFWEFGLFSGAKWLLVSGRVVMTCSQKGRLLGGRLSHVKHQKTEVSSASQWSLETRLHLINRPKTKQLVLMKGVGGKARSQENQLIVFIACFFSSVEGWRRVDVVNCWQHFGRMDEVTFKLSDFGPEVPFSWRWRW